MANGDVLVRVEREGATARLLLNRPEKKNALSDALLDSFNTALDRALADATVHTVVVGGLGSCFSAGRDVREFGEPVQLQDQSLDAKHGGFMRALTTLSEAPKPTIAAVRGFAFGGGQAMTLACDFLVAERGARFGNVEMQYGFPAAMNLVLLARHLGRRTGLEIALTGETYAAERYFELGLVNRLAEPGDLERETQALAEVLNGHPPWAVARTKATFRLAEEMTLQGALHTGNQLNQLLSLAGQTTPFHSGSAAARAAIKGEGKA